MKTIDQFLGLDSDKIHKIMGTDGADTLADTAKTDTIDAGAGNDTITDTLGGNDTILGGDGDDTITITRAEATSVDSLSVSGGAGDDSISYTGDIANQVAMVIDAGAGANAISVTNAYDVHIVGGDDIDTVDLTTDHYAVVRANDGADVVNLDNTDGDARTGVLGGGGDDIVNIASDSSGHYRLSLGEGVDVINLSAATVASAEPKLVFYTFDTGDAGDQLNISDYLDSVLTNVKPGSDPFHDGHLRLVEGVTAGGEAATFLDMDIDGKKGAAEWVHLAVFVGVAAEDLTAVNLGGLDPVVTPPAEADGLVI